MEEPKAGEFVIGKGARGNPYIAKRCSNSQAGYLLDDVPEARGTRRAYRKPIKGKPIL